MAMAATLEQAAALCDQQLRLKAQAAPADTLKTALGTFNTAAASIFPDEIPNNRPVGNWLIPLSQIQLTMTPNGVVGPDPANANYTAVRNAVDAVYRMCWAAQAAIDAALCTGAQGVALLAAWNTAFGT